MTLHILTAAACFMAAFALGVAIVALKKTESWATNFMDHATRQRELNEDILNICKSNTSSIKDLSDSVKHLSSACNSLCDVTTLLSEKMQS